MKLSVFLLVCSIGLAQAADSYAQKATVNLEMRNQTVKEVLDEIEEQSDFSFFFNIKHVEFLSWQRKAIYSKFWKRCLPVRMFVIRW